MMGERATLEITAAKGKERITLDLHQASEAERLAIIVGVFGLFMSDEERTSRAYAEFFATVDGREFHGSAPFKPLRFHNGRQAPADLTEWWRQLREKQNREVAAAKAEFEHLLRETVTEFQAECPHDAGTYNQEGEASTTTRCSRCHMALADFEKVTTAGGKPETLEAISKAAEIAIAQIRDDKGRFVKGWRKAAADATAAAAPETPAEAPTPEQLQRLKATIEGQSEPSNDAGDGAPQQEPTEPARQKPAHGDNVGVNLRARAREAYAARQEFEPIPAENMREDTWQPNPGYTDDCTRESDKQQGVLLYKARYWCKNIICGNKGKRYVKLDDDHLHCHNCSAALRIRPATPYTNPENMLPVRDSHGAYFRADELMPERDDLR